MPLKIDISDVAIEKKEAIHQLHIWGVQTSLWKNNCVVCGKNTDAARIRCSCGEGFFCSPACQNNRGAMPQRQCAQISRCPLKNRPSPNHRRAVIFHSGAPNLSFVWIEIKGSHLIIDHPRLDECYGYPGIGSAWLDLAVINPAAQSAAFRKIGHGLAVGFSSSMLEPEITVDPKWRNKGLTEVSGPGHRVLWPGPLVFFCYGYDLSDYVKVDPTQPDSVEPSAEAGMSKLDIWNELSALRLRSSRFSASTDEKKIGRDTARRKARIPGANSNMVWKWKVKEHGTSMRILDLVHRDLSTVLRYISCTELNPIPKISPGDAYMMRAVHIQNPNHPGYAIQELWSQVNPLAQAVADERKESSLTLHTPNGETIGIKTIRIPLRPRGVYPVLGAFAVGLRWLSIARMDINPPFRGNLPTSSSITTSPLSPFMDLAWTIHLPAGTASPSALLSLTLPNPATCDSLIITHSHGTGGAGIPVLQHHARALLKYLAHTPPTRWARRGRHGFERYWEVYARAGMQTPGAPGPYELEECIVELEEFEGAPEVERVLAHVTLEGLAKGDEPRRGEIEERRRVILKAVGWYRANGGWFGKGVDGRVRVSKGE